MQVSSLTQRSDQWHAWRNSGIGASEAGVIAASIGLLDKPAPWMGTSQALWEVKMELRSAAEFSNFAMQRGIDFEDEAADLYSEATGNIISPVCAAMDEYPFIKASFDGISLDKKIIVEIKIPGQEVIELASRNEVVPYYVAQCAQQCLVAWGHPDDWPEDGEHHFFVYQPETGVSHLVKRRASEYRSYALQLLGGLVAFWGHIENKTPPCGDKWIQAALIYRLSVVDYELAKAAKEKANKEMVALLEASQRSQSGGGVTVTRSSKQGLISYADFVEAKGIDPAELEPFRGATTEQYRVTVEKKAPLPKASEAAPLAPAAVARSVEHALAQERQPWSF